MFCGDGINDLAALSAADIGMAIGADAVIAAELSTSNASVAGQPSAAFPSHHTTYDYCEALRHCLLCPNKDWCTLSGKYLKVEGSTGCIFKVCCCMQVLPTLSGSPKVLGRCSLPYSRYVCVSTSSSLYSYSACILLHVFTLHVFSDLLAFFSSC